MKATPSRAAAMALIGGLVWSAGAVAVGWTGAQQVKAIKLKNNGHVLVQGKNADWKNPDGCQDATYVAVQASNPSHREKLAVIIAAKNAQSNINFLVQGCVTMGSNSYGDVKEIELR